MNKNSSQTIIEELLERGVEDVIDREVLVKKLVAGKPLRIKLGIDPTAADLHLGHSVVLRKLRQFQDAGHTAVLIIGDFTTLIGDPSGRTTSRPPLTSEQIRDNMKDYIKQAAKVIDIDRAEIHYNSEWFSPKPMSFLMDLAGRFTVARLIEREDFQKRLKDGFDVSMLELLYPLLQGYDSVAVRADIELGGYDQRLNLLFGRKVQRAFSQPEQDVVTVPLLIGTDGEKKMSKSVGNYIKIDEKPEKMFTQVMAVPDNLMWNYFELLTDVPAHEIAVLRCEVEAGQTHPRDAKMDLAARIVFLYWDQNEAKRARQEYVSVTQQDQLPSDIPATKVADNEVNIVDLIVMIRAAASKSEARRLVTQGGVKVDNDSKTDWKEVVAVKDGMIVRVGKSRFFKVVK
ncbi:MAG: tyrosine--tRNA ligase [Candidatus Pacebacteria bacterium]|nr:tyrosine--tRNA ligase [Candidatus Paceibacterota bacterium]